MLLRLLKVLAALVLSNWFQLSVRDAAPSKSSPLNFSIFCYCLTLDEFDFQLERICKYGGKNVLIICLHASHVPLDDEITASCLLMIFRCDFY